MERLGRGWYVFGAQAAVAYGRPRLTADVDITVDAGPMDALALAGELAAAGFALRIDLGADYLREARLLPLVHAATSMPVDLMLASTRLHAELLSRRRMVDIGGLPVPVLSPEDLIVTKLLAGRRKDIEDVQGVLEARSDIDLDLVRGLLSDLSAALDDARPLGRLERLLRRSR